MTTAPVRITRRAPTRSTNVPTTGDRTPCTTDDSEKAPAARPRDQRNSSSSGTRKTENENMRPNAMPSVSQTATMRSHGEVEPGAVGAVTLRGRIRRLHGARLTVRGRGADDPGHDDTGTCRSRRARAERGAGPPGHHEVGDLHLGRARSEGAGDAPARR